MKKLIFLFCFFSLLFVCAEDVGFCNFLDVRSWGKSPTREVAKKYGCSIASVDTMIKRVGHEIWKKKYLRDVVHPNQAGHQLIANEILKCF